MIKIRINIQVKEQEVQSVFPHLIEQHQSIRNISHKNKSMHFKGFGIKYVKDILLMETMSRRSLNHLDRKKIYLKYGNYVVEQAKDF